MKTLYNNLKIWLEGFSKEPINNNIKAICFNLYDDGNGNWSLEMVGTASFDQDDPDWACDEITDFGTRNSPFFWNENCDWESVLEEVSRYISIYLEAGILDFVKNQVEAIAVGFVDGDINIIFTKDVQNFQ